MRIYCCILFMLLASCSSPDVATSTSSGGVAGVAGVDGSTDSAAGGGAAGDDWAEGSGSTLGGALAQAPHSDSKGAANSAARGRARPRIVKEGRDIL
jgi:hypothetical protein